MLASIDGRTGLTLIAHTRDIGDPRDPETPLSTASARPYHLGEDGKSSVLRHSRFYPHFMPEPGHSKNILTASGRALNNGSMRSSHATNNIMLATHQVALKAQIAFLAARTVKNELLPVRTLRYATPGERCVLCTREYWCPGPWMAAEAETMRVLRHMSVMPDRDAAWEDADACAIMFSVFEWRTDEPACISAWIPGVVYGSD